MKPERTPDLKTVNRLAENLLRLRSEAVEARAASGVERRWREDIKAYEGLDDTNKSFMFTQASQLPTNPTLGLLIGME